MGRSKKKFIQKGEGQHYYVMHRSNTDSAHATEENPSNFVLVKAENTTRGNKDQETTTLRKGVENHVDSLGFRNDGYDYSQHLRVMGGGKFIGADGTMRNLPTPISINLPADILPSEIELERNLEAITINHELMDDDIRDVLFGEVDDFEELDDDFMATALVPPEKPDFDYDAHIANLIAKSERNTIGTVPLGSGEDFDDDDDSGYYDSDGDEGSDGEEEERPVGGGERRVESDRRTVMSRMSRGTVLTPEQRVLMESQFAKTMLDYCDEELGDLEEEMGDGLGGGQLDLADIDQALDEALDEFMEEAKDGMLMDGVPLPPKGARILSGLEREHGQEYLESDPAEVARKIQDFVIESTVNLDEGRKFLTPQEYEDDLFSNVLYLKEERPQEKWDCETILSTYSTLDNHPALIAGPPPRRKGTSTAGSMASTTNSRQSDSVYFSRGTLKSVSQPSHSSTATLSQQRSGKIVLTGKHSFPKGFGPSHRAGGGVVPVVHEEGEEDLSGGDHSESERSGEDKDEDADKPDVNSRKGETAEEKKARKQKMKQMKKDKRATKKQLKQAFKSEGVRQSRLVGAQQDTDGVSVFKYTV